jgi:hypothetical protein
MSRKQWTITSDKFLSKLQIEVDPNRWTLFGLVLQQQKIFDFFD